MIVLFVGVASLEHIVIVFVACKVWSRFCRFLGTRIRFKTYQLDGSIYDAQGEGYQVSQSIIALGKWRIQGLGLGHSPRNLYLPELQEHTSILKGY